ncbi:hypothetical protein TNCV_4448351 [Trichonephila clavipes]|nr:hypothetical protein TNCV_4448351 [Trichonephila clavipes]
MVVVLIQTPEMDFKIAWRGSRGRGSLVIKVTDWGHEYEPRIAGPPPYRGGRCMLNRSKLKRPSAGVERKLEEGCRPRHLTYAHNPRVAL